MTDDLDVLRHERDVIEPDPQFRAELMDRLRSEMTWSNEVVPTTLTPSTGRPDATVDDEPSTPPSMEQYVSDGPRRHPRRWLAVAAVVLLVAAVVAAIRDDGGKGDVDTVPLAITGLARGETMDLAASPLSRRTGPALVWSGTEMIVWGGQDRQEQLGDGAAFDPATGSWRLLAPAPIEARGDVTAAWTGTEMIIFGGYHVRGDTVEYFRDGAAYNPSTDTWRRVPDAPIEGGGEAVWTDDELIVVNGGGSAAAAYNPVDDEWRKLAFTPGEAAGSLVWTGEVVLATAFGGEETDAPASLLRYDPESDQWETVSDESYAYLLPVPDAEGEVRSVLAVPTESGGPVAVLDRNGGLERSRPGVPGARETFGTRIQPADGASYRAMWLGDEALFWMHSLDSGMGSLETPAPWALDPETGTWRSLGTSAPPFDSHLELMADAGLLVGWRSTSGTEGLPSTGIAYRPPGLKDAVVVVPDRLGLPEPGEQPVDPAAAEAQVRAAFLTLFQQSLPREQRAAYVERPEVWIAANTELAEGQYGPWLEDQYAEVDGVVFTSPTHAKVRFRLVAPDERVPEMFENFAIGDAVLTDGRWLVAISTPCDALARAPVAQCDLSL